MTLPWFRMYAKFSTDTKVQSMDETLQRRFVMFLCLHCKGEFDGLSLDELAFALRIEPMELQRTIDAFKAKGFLDENGKIRNWSKLQYKSDSSAGRVKKHRESKKKQRGNDDETLQKRPQIQITDTESEDEDSRRAASGEPVTVDQALFVEARRIFGKSIGGQINTAIRTKGKPWVLGVIEACRPKDPEAARAYLAAALNGAKKPDEVEQRRHHA